MLNHQVDFVVFAEGIKRMLAVSVVGGQQREHC